MCSKPLIELLNSLPEQNRPNINGQGDALSDIFITSITQDSRAVVAGSLFAAIQGSAHNGEDYIYAAIKSGAAAILVAEDGLPAGVAATSPAPPQGRSKSCITITHSNPRLALSLMAEAFYRPQPSHKIAITGTDGKTSTAEFTRQLWELCECPAISVGTLGLKSARPLANLPTLSDNTSPEPASFYEALSACAKQGVQHVVVEASSIGIAQHRLAGFSPSIAIFTSFSQDHLDYHATMEAYFKAKSELFSELLTPQGVSILCADYAEIATLATELKAQGRQVITYGANTQGANAQADLRITTIKPFVEGQEVYFTYMGEDFNVTAPLYGDFQAYNLLAASLAVATDLGQSLAEVISHWGRIEPIKGRLQLAGTTKNGALIFVDYAHTAGALQKALQTLRPYALNKLHVLFGCGGDRDKSKRPQMGAVAHELADQITITDDNPRTEDAANIRASIIAACPKALEIADRAQAIAHAINQLKAGDVLLIAGKGHEDYQIIGTTKHPFDDALEVQKNI